MQSWVSTRKAGRPGGGEVNRSLQVHVMTLSAASVRTEERQMI